MNSPNQKNMPKQDVSWFLLLTVAGVIIGSLFLLRHNVLYTEGEVMQGLFTLLVWLLAACILIGLRRRLLALWCITLIGGSLLVWQTYQTRKWAVIHEDIVAIVRFVEDSKVKTGHYPVNLDGYTFKNESVKSHIYAFESVQTNGFRITYFMNDTGISYWYSSQAGFGYYPD